MLLARTAWLLQHSGALLAILLDHGLIRVALGAQVLRSEHTGERLQVWAQVGEWLHEDTIVTLVLLTGETSSSQVKLLNFFERVRLQFLQALLF